MVLVIPRDPFVQEQLDLDAQDRAWVERVKLDLRHILVFLLFLITWAIQ